MGLLKAGIERLHQGLAAHVGPKTIPGLAALVSCHDEVHVETLGHLSAEHGAAAVGNDTLFRIASLTKPVTAVATMILLEECRLRLDDSIEPWLPELANRRVLRSMDSEPEDTVPAHRAITVRDLLTYRMGFGSVMAPPDTYPIQRLVRENQIGGDGPPRPSLAPQEDEWLRRLGSLPWMAQPGERWLYHVSGDVLGMLVARVTGQTFGSFLKERLFDPLGMKNTAFFVSPGEIHRLSTCYRTDAATGDLEVFDDAAHTTWLNPPPFEAGGGGLISTIPDYFAFCRMMLAQGRYAGHGGPAQILSRASVTLMTSDQLTPEQRSGSEVFFGDFSSWGLGVAVDTARREIYQTPGRFGWTGGLGTTAYTDPAEQTIALLFTQRMMDSPTGMTVFSDFFTLAYAALE